ncbi:MAG: GNAT family N-acetyltransferase [Actinomycetota bacterium]|nr:GNAT family N-acetyltransferase [Actinomycetota bacterium]
MIEVSRVDAPSFDILNALNNLVPQLSSSARPLEFDDFATLLANKCVNFLIAADSETGRIVGTLTLVVFPIPTGLRAWIEDVIVDSSARGMGIGKLLVKKAIEMATLQGVKSVDLTSRPSRVEANSLYVGLGFVVRETNVYRFDGS